MSSPVCTISPDASVNDCCNVLENHQVRRVLVVKSDGSCCGIVSQADLALHAPGRKTAEVLKEVSQPA
jgi:CBS domain-containing protein